MTSLATNPRHEPLVLRPIYVPITEKQIEEASDILAELMIRYLRRKHSTSKVPTVREKR